MQAVGILRGAGEVVVPAAAGGDPRRDKVIYKLTVMDHHGGQMATGVLDGACCTIAQCAAADRPVLVTGDRQELEFVVEHLGPCGHADIRITSEVAWF